MITGGSSNRGLESITRFRRVKIYMVMWALASWFGVLSIKSGRLKIGKNQVPGNYLQDGCCWKLMYFVVWQLKEIGNRSIVDRSGGHPSVFQYCFDALNEAHWDWSGRSLLVSLNDLFLHLFDLLELLAIVVINGSIC